MKRKIILCGLILIMLFTMMGCGSKKLTYQGNLGLDVSKVDCQKIVFKVYHSNTKDHMWKKLAEFPYDKDDDSSPDIRVDGAEGKITIALESNSYIEEKDSGRYTTKDLDSYEYNVDQFDGFINIFQTYEIEDITDEQFYRLYPISNDSGGIYTSVDLNQPYDSDETNLDNILITVTIKR